MVRRYFQRNGLNQDRGIADGLRQVEPKNIQPCGHVERRRTAPESKHLGDIPAARAFFNTSWPSLIPRRGPAKGGQAVGGSKDMDPVAVWSRDDLVPVGFNGYRIREFALGGGGSRWAGTHPLRQRVVGWGHFAALK